MAPGDGFRLIADPVLLAPTRGLREAVPGNADTGALTIVSRAVAIDATFVDTRLLARSAAVGVAIRFGNGGRAPSRCSRRDAAPADGGIRARAGTTGRLASLVAPPLAALVPMVACLVARYASSRAFMSIGSEVVVDPCDGAGT